LAEVTARIPVHNPEWRNFNDSDPGMTLLQLWAFMSENVLYQTQLVPDRVRLKFLELLGIEVAPAAAAKGIVAFDVPKGRLEMITIGVDQEVLAGRVPFRTTTGLTAAPVEVRAYVKRSFTPSVDVIEQYELLYPSFRDAGTALAYYATTPVEWPASVAEPLALSDNVDGAVWLAVLARKPIEVAAARELLGGKVLSIGVVPDVTLDELVLPPAGSAAATNTDAFEFHLPDTSVDLLATVSGRVPTYRPIETRTTTNVLVEPGLIELLLPDPDRLSTWTDLEPLEAGVGSFPPALEGVDQERLITWIRVRPAAGSTSDTAGGSTTRLTWIGANAALVEQRAHIAREQVGVGSGVPDQRFRLARSPVLLDTVLVSVDGEPWALVDDLMEAGPEVPATTSKTSTEAKPTGQAASGGSEPASRTTVVKVMRATGDVVFGDGLHGARPANGAVITATYDVGGGAIGLVGAGSINKAAFLPAGATVTNPVPTWGGAEAPTVAQSERSIAAFVRHRDRMVAGDDFAAIVRQVPGADFGRIEVLPLVHPDLPGQQLPGMVTLLLIPRTDPITPDAPTPDQHLLRAVCDYVEERRLLTTELHLRGPEYVPVSVSIGIDVMAGRAIGTVREAVKAAVRSFLSPLNGGHTGTGWPLLTPVSRLELIAVAARVDGVAKVFDVIVAVSGETPAEQVEMSSALRLPRLVGLEVRQGDPLPIADLQGVAEPAPALPIPVIPEECC
jgi:hypothetical protein